MHVAIELGRKQVLKMFLDGGAQPNKEDVKGRTPLHWAVLKMRFCKETVQLLLERGADPNKADERGRTPLQLASKMGYKEVAQQMSKQKTTAKGKGEQMQASFISKPCPIL